MNATIYDQNKEIAVLANRKELKAAWNVFKELYDTDQANIHTYAAIVNAAVRCGDMALAEEVTTMMQAKRVSKDTIICTTLLKGYCSQCSVTKVVALFKEMKKNNKMKPNIRTFNTLLRGFVQSGEVKLAEKLVAEEPKNLKIDLDVSSWEYLIVLLSQNLAIDKIQPLIGRLKSNPQMQSGLVHIFLEHAKACLLLGDWKNGRKALTFSDQELKKLEDNVTAISKATDVNDNTVVDSSEVKKKEVTGGKKAWKSGKDQEKSIDENRNHSLEIFRLHQCEEWKEDIAKLENFLSLHQYQNIDMLDFLLPFFRHTLLFNSDSTLPKKVGISTVNSVSLSLFDALAAKFGLDSVLKRLSGHTVQELLILHRRYKRQQKAAPAGTTIITTDKVVAPPIVEKKEAAVEEEDSDSDSSSSSSSSSSSESDSDSDSNSSSSSSSSDDEKDSKEKITTTKVKKGPSRREIQKKQEEIPVVMTESMQRAITCVKDMKRLLASYFTSDLYLHFPNIFPSLVASDSGEKKKPQYKLEICSGAGEWVVTQAKNDSTNAWVSLEFRYDRVYQTFSKMIFDQVPNNLCVMAGDAKLVVPRYIAPSSFDWIFVNHPEPPQQTGGRDDSEAAHLLDMGFFLEMYRILCAEGTLTIVTDNLWYGKLLTRQVDAMNDGSSLLFTTVSMTDQSANKKRKNDAAADSSSSAWKVKFESGQTTLYVGVPGPLAGHMVQASSYFDRLWKRGALEERFFLVLRKTRVNPTSAKVQQHIERLRAEDKALAEAILLSAATANLVAGTFTGNIPFNSTPKVNQHKRLDLEEVIKPESQSEKEVDEEEVKANNEEDEKSEVEKDKKLDVDIDSSSDSDDGTRRPKKFRNRQQKFASAESSSDRKPFIPEGKKDFRNKDSNRRLLDDKNKPFHRQDKSFSPRFADGSIPKWNLKKRDENGKKRRKRDLLKAAGEASSVPLQGGEEPPVKKVKQESL